MYVVALDYVADLAEIDALIPLHTQWLDRHYASGVFLASGRRDPRIGGAILAADVSRDDLDAVLAEDPFAVNGVARYTVTRYVVSRTADGLEQLLSD